MPPIPEPWFKAVGGGILKFGGGIVNGGGCDKIGNAGIGTLRLGWTSFVLFSFSLAFLSLVSSRGNQGAWDELVKQIKGSVSRAEFFRLSTYLAFP